MDAVCDKAFIVPCWIFLLSTMPSLSSYLILWFLILTETTSACVRFRAFYTAGGVAAPNVIDFDFSTSAVKADHIGKAKQTFEMFGTAFFLLPYLRCIGLILLALACPLAYESVRRKLKKRVIYVCCSSNISGKEYTFDHKLIKFWTQAAAMGSKLIVGVIGEKQKDMVCNACSIHCVNQVIAEAPAKVDLHFLENHEIDFVFFLPHQQGLVTQEVVSAGVCLVLGDDHHTARQLKPKQDVKKE